MAITRRFGLHSNILVLAISSILEFHKRSLNLFVMSNVNELTFSSKKWLSDGHHIPVIGLGVYQMSDSAGSASGSETESSVLAALSKGITLIDTAECYRNEQEVGKAIKASGIARRELFISTKLWRNGLQSCQKSFVKSLEKLQTDYVDLYLIHSPFGNKIIETYKQMLEFQKQGKIKSVGVSNFNVHHLEGIKKAGLPAPAVNQIELHPWCRQQEIVDYCNEHNIALMAYSPLAQGKYMSSGELLSVTEHYANKTAAQVLIRWGVQKGFVSIPKSSHSDRISQNIDVFDFSLTPADLEAMSSFPFHRVCWDPTVDPWKG